jgi:hypothetical protein
LEQKSQVLSETESYLIFEIHHEGILSLLFAAGEWNGGVGLGSVVPSRIGARWTVEALECWAWCYTTELGGGQRKMEQSH